MTGSKRTEQAHSLVQGFSGARSALEEVFEHYKMGRYGEAFPEKAYFLLSRCTHVLFSLWLAEQENERGFFRTASPPAAFSLGLDFGELRYSEYKRRLLHGDGLEEHLRNETKWFEFWVRILEQFDKSNAAAYQTFCQQLLASVREPGFLEGKANRRALQAFMRGDEAGRVLAGTMRILEDVLRAIAGCFTAAGTSTCVAERMILLTGLLREIRRILLWETPAKGPYALCGKTRWQTPSLLRRLLRNRIPGFLTVVPRREGGQIVCTFEPSPDSAGRRASWMRPMTSLAGTYEAELFATWSYSTGTHEEHPDQFPGLQACWTVQNAEAGRLEILSKQMDSLLAVLQRNPACTQLATAVRCVLRNGVPEWQATALPWTYISQLDQLIDKLTFLYREAKATGGDDAAQSVIERIWPSAKAAPERDDPHSRQDRRDQRNPRTLPSVPAAEPSPGPPAQAAAGTLASLLQRLGGGHTLQPRNLAGDLQGASISPERSYGAAGAELVSQESPGAARAIRGAPQGDPASQRPQPQPSPTPQPSACQTPAMQGEQESKGLPPIAPTDQKDSEAESKSGMAEAATDPKPPDSADAGASPQSGATDSEKAAAPAPRALRRQRPPSDTRTKDTDRPGEMEQALLRRLLEHHERPDGTIDCKPLSSAELRRDLDWSLSKVQRALTNVFGPKPANTYRNKCRNRTICAFLKARVGAEKTPRAPVQAQKVRKAPRASAKTNPRRKSRRRVSV